MRNVVQRFRLRNRPGEAIQDVSLLAVRFLEPFLHNGDDHLVRYQLARVDEGLGLQPRGGLLLDGTAENVAGGNLGDAQRRADALRLRSLARAGRS